MIAGASDAVHQGDPDSLVQHAHSGYTDLRVGELFVSLGQAQHMQRCTWMTTAMVMTMDVREPITILTTLPAWRDEPTSMSVSK